MHAHHVTRQRLQRRPGASQERRRLASTPIEHKLLLPPTQAKAQELGLTGWVRNRLNGQVEVVAEGGESELRALETWLHSGSPESSVSGVQSSWAAASGEYASFERLHTQ